MSRERPPAWSVGDTLLHLATHDSLVQAALLIAFVGAFVPITTLGANELAFVVEIVPRVLLAIVVVAALGRGLGDLPSPDERAFWDDLLLAAGVEIDAEDTSDARETALVKAINQPSPDRLTIIERLAAAGADLDRQHGEAGMTPIMYAATADVYTPDPYSKVFGEATRQLVAHGARLDTTDNKGNTVWRLIKRNAMGALTSSPYRRRLFQMLRVLEGLGAEQMASHEV